ncbi:NFX1-type zinc finger-containing protein 1 [Podospora aff. communis PSN243]|uniref:NFX1-type zinc finger-containing protein 1 n=1 Tax=Podospora aff. communis PSN243 TaxID=3040156 RepID=A0AAV9GEN1_9PEZI|nr:NFX1-type zinc finger-containing protein 1 [Podospora aff. communis PSN243]
MSARGGHWQGSNSTWRGGSRAKGSRGGFQQWGSRHPAQTPSSASPCNFFFKHGTCRFGSGCAAFSSFLAFSPNTVSDMWSQAGDVLDGMGHEWHQRLVRDLVDGVDGVEPNNANGMELLHATMRMKHNFQDLGNLRGIQYFLRVITHPSLLDCLSIETYVGTMYNIISGVNGDRAISFFTRIYDALTEHGIHNEAPETASESLEGMLDALYELLRREKRASLHPDLPTLLDGFSSVLRSLEASVPNNFQRHSDRITRLRRIVDLTSDRLVDGTTHDEQPTNGFLDGHHVFPHETRFPDSRHDNDHEDISQISIMPTPGEIANSELDYLPSTDCRQPHFLHDPVQRYIDTHFRLLRHDILGPLKDTLGMLMSSFEQQGAVSNVQSMDLNAHIYKEACIPHIAVDSRRGFEAHVSFSSPAQLNKKSNEEKKQWWDSCKRLEPGGLVSFVCVDDDRAVPLLLIITDKSTESKERGPCLTPNSHQKPTIGAKLASNSLADLQRLVKVYQGKTQGILVDVPGLIPATFVPILGNLQRMMAAGELPFQDWIVPKIRANPDERVLHPPQYAQRPGFSFSLKSISNTTGGAALSVSPTSSPNDTQLIESMEARTGLDRGQCQAMVAALTREFACIQGPPGTGKSYMGVKLLQVLLDSKSAASLGPIIIICYTNHALDQFLKHLLAVGITKVVRIGGKSRCPELDDFNLRAKTATMSKTRHESYILGRTHGELETHMGRMGKRLGSLHKIRSDAASHHSIRRLLKRKHPAISCQFDATDEEGFTQAGRDPLVPPSSSTRPASFTKAEERGVDSLQPEERQTEETNMLFEDICSAERLRETLDSVHGELNRRALLTADVIGITTTGMARDVATLRKLRAKVVVCEEAAEVLEAHMISTLMPGVEHVIQIGDHQQLRPQINNYSLSLETQQGMLYQVDRSQFERLAVGEPGIPPMPIAQLNIQRRMRPQIASLIRDTMYPALQDHPSVADLPDVVGMRENVFWLDHPHMEDSAGDDGRLKSHSKTWEVSMTKALVRHLIRQGAYKSTDIAILTPYTGQLQKLRASLGKDFEISLSDKDEDKLAQDGFELAMDTSSDEGKLEIAAKNQPSFQRKQLLQSLRLATVDNFQGEEAQVVIVSLARSNPSRKVGFLRTKNRINVLLSRAQHGLYLIGNKDTYTNVPMWATVRNKLEAVGAVSTAFNLCCPRHTNRSIQCATPEDFLLNSPEGGCNIPCDRRLSACGHRCQTKCHSEAMHVAFLCPQPCPRVRTTCEHACPKLCGEPCGLCQVLVDGVVLPCGHVKDRLPCHRAQEKDKIACLVLVKKTVAMCGHVVEAQCSKDVNARVYSCQTPCAELLACGHQYPGTCGSCTPKTIDGNGRKAAEHRKCRKRCGKPRDTCGHTCGEECHVQCPHSRCSRPCQEPCTPCIEPCAWACEHQRSCNMPCAAPCSRLPCNERCAATLDCGHQCPSLCGETCPKGYCQACGHKGEDRVDLLEFKTYMEIDLSETPIVVIDCGHFFTAESLDGLVSMGQVYHADEAGRYSGLSKPSELLAVPCCPDCKRPIRQFATRRFNRVVNMAVMDETAKKFRILGETELEGFRQRATEGEESLRSSQALTGANMKHFSGTTRRCAELRALEDEITKFCSRMGADRQPSRKLHDAIIKSREKEPLERRLGQLTVSNDDTHLMIPAPDEQIILHAQQLLLGVQTVIFQHQVSVLGKLPAASAMTADFGIPKRVEDLLRGYSNLIRQAKEGQLRRVIVHSVIGALLDCGLKICDGPMDSSGNLRKALEDLQQLLRRPWYEESAMVSGPRGIATHSGHWYKCQNGHVFAIGECGMPMELARCPECASPIGGQNHSLQSGVTRAQEMEG